MSANDAPVLQIIKLHSSALFEMHAVFPLKAISMVQQMSPDWIFFSMKGVLCVCVCSPGGAGEFWIETA